MWPTIRDNQFAVLDRYWFREPARGDVIVFKAPPEPKSYYVKRIIGIPGDIITIDRSSVTLDGVTLSEPYVSKSLQGNKSPYPHLFIVVPPDGYFVMGDDRLYSYDSRFWGFVPSSSIVGRLVYLYGGSPDNTGFLPDASVVFSQIHPTGVFQTSSPSGTAAPSGSVLLIGFPAAASLYNRRRQWVSRKKTQYKKTCTPQPIRCLNHRTVWSQAVHLALPVLVVLMLCSCGILPPQHHQPSNDSEKQLVAPKPFLALVVYLDNTLSFPVQYQQEAASNIADRIQSYISPGMAGMFVDVSLIEVNSLQNAYVSFSVPAIQAIPPKPQPGNDPYQYATALQEWKKTVAQINGLVTSVRATIKPYLDKMRSLHLQEVGGTDLPGSADSAAAEFSHFPTGNKMLLYVSDMQSNVNTQFSTHINLYGAKVRVIYRVCQIESACEQNDGLWTKQFRAWGASSYEAFDPAQSHAEHITF